MLVDTSHRILFSSARVAPLKNDNDSLEITHASPDHSFSFSLDCGRGSNCTLCSVKTRNDTSQDFKVNDLHFTHSKSKLSEARTGYTDYDFQSIPSRIAIQPFSLNLNSHS
jgi:hypothetical protein